MPNACLVHTYSQRAIKLIDGHYKHAFARHHMCGVRCVASCYCSPHSHIRGTVDRVIIWLSLATCSYGEALP